jgi:hypothetical protein
LAYTVTTLSSEATLVGTSGSDVVTAPTSATKSITVNSFEGNDALTLGTAISSGGSVGMGGGLDVVTVSAVVEDVNITLGDAIDTYTTSAIDDGVTVGGQGGADTFTFGAAVTSSRYAGGQGADEFVSTTGALGSKTTIVGGSEVDTIGTSGARFQTGTNNFINGQVGADSIFLTAAADTTVYGGSEADTINNSADVDGLLLSGDKGADTIVDGDGDNTLSGGDGSDTITAGAGADTLTGGLGADDFVLLDTVTAAAVVTTDTITDFTVADDQVGNYSVSDLEVLTILTDLVEAGNAASVATGNLEATVTKVTSAYNLGTAGTGSILALGSNTAFTTTTVATAIKTGGDLALTNNGTTALAAADGFVIFYDDNIDTYAALVTTAGGVGVNSTSSDFVVTNLTKFDGLSDATTITTSNLLAFVG